VCDSEAGACAVSALQIDSTRRAHAAATAAKEKSKGLLDARGAAPPRLLGPHCLWGPLALPIGHSQRCNAVYNVALEEAGLAAEDVSEYGCNVPKMPYSWVEQILAMNHTKTHNYNFQGAHAWSLDLQEQGMHWPQFENRNWVIGFAKANFSDNDYFELTDADAQYEPMGPWDHSNVSAGSFNSHGTHEVAADEIDDYMAMFDREYFEVMSSSNFTLCPGGDMPWSMRFYEAIASGSIPVIKHHAFDLSAPNLWALWEIPYKYYTLDNGDNIVYRQDWVDYNLDLFLKYQTFHYGDQRPLAPGASGE